ncbi:hypothetical protein ACJX0J_005794, partial [Zea mays]
TDEGIQVELSILFLSKTTHQLSFALPINYAKTYQIGHMNLSHKTLKPGLCHLLCAFVTHFFFYDLSHVHVSCLLLYKIHGKKYYILVTILLHLQASNNICNGDLASTCVLFGTTVVVKIWKLDSHFYIIVPVGYQIK